LGANAGDAMHTARFGFRGRNGHDPVGNQRDGLGEGD
jgi:hypothetical protein